MGKWWRYIMKCKGPQNDLRGMLQHCCQPESLYLAILEWEITGTVTVVSLSVRSHVVWMYVCMYYLFTYYFSYIIPFCIFPSTCHNPAWLLLYNPRNGKPTVKSFRTKSCACLHTVCCPQADPTQAILPNCPPPLAVPLDTPSILSRCP